MENIHQLQIGEKYQINAPLKNSNESLTEWGAIFPNISSSIFYTGKEGEIETFFSRWGGITSKMYREPILFDSGLLRITIPTESIAEINCRRIVALHSPISRIVLPNEELLKDWNKKVEEIQGRFRCYIPFGHNFWFRPF